MKSMEEMVAKGCGTRNCDGPPVLRPLERTEHYDTYRCAECGVFYGILFNEDGRKRKEWVRRAADVMQNGLKD